ncbi:DUF4143 domain-containing protein, partial [Paratractidigestivibacter sp.]|uniref:DUF4143 domain-containing protein n=1 Tax=Paratractidigestivibacter sp. TaxID=2847316 RepID=UPI003A101D71
KTAKTWLSLLESSYMVKVVQPYSNNLLKRLSKQPIMHFLDTGLAAYLAGWTSATSACSTRSRRTRPKTWPRSSARWGSGASSAWRRIPTRSAADPGLFRSGRRGRAAECGPGRGGPHAAGPIPRRRRRATSRPRPSRG